MLGLGNAKPVPTPGVPTHREPTEDETYLDPEKHTLYRSALGCVLYYVHDRADAQVEASICGGALQAPTERHLVALKRMVRYLKGTSDMVNVLRKPKNAVGNLMHLGVYTDSDWADDKETRKSQSSYHLVADDEEAPLDHISRRQGPVSLSSGEAEFYAATSGTANAIAPKGVFEFFGYKVHMSLYMDSSTGRSIARREGRGRVKHLDVRSMWLQQLVKQKVILPTAVNTIDNKADLGTTILAAPRLEFLRRACGIVPRQEVDKKFARGEPDMHVEESMVDPDSGLKKTGSATVGAILVKAILDHCRATGRLKA